MTTKEQNRQNYAKRCTANAALPKVPCACGCGTLIAPITVNGTPATYAKGHHTKGKPGRVAWNKIGDVGLPPAERTKRHREQRYADIEQMPKVACACGCGTLIAPVNKQLRPSKYAKGHNSRGSLNNHWRDGATKIRYGAGFTQGFKRLILKRDNHTCQRCGATQISLKMPLQVHHLDHNKQNNDPSNLAAACNKCNMWASYHRDEPFIP